MRIFALCLGMAWGAAAFAEDHISFNRDVRPVLAEKCFACHGPDEHARRAGLRFDLEGPAFQLAKSGAVALVPGDLEKSELVRRIALNNDEKMPPSEFGKDLSPAEIDLLKRWVAQGAKYEKHWSMIPPKAVEPPAVQHLDQVRNPIDNFVIARLERDGLTISPDADKAILARRVTLDLTGLPPAPDAVDNFVGDTRPDAYEHLVDRLLSAPEYGEHLARNWMDLARYADTNGYAADNERFMWRWRDWVIDAFNRNLPYDQFCMQQLAGDLMPGATQDEVLATGFLRNHMTIAEGGVIPEEYRTHYVLDRVNTTSTVFLGLTLACAQCHDHKYDPFTMRDYYRLFAFFNQVPEFGADGRFGNAEPVMKVPSPEQAARGAQLTAQINALRDQLEAPRPELDAAQPAWESSVRARVAGRWLPLETASISSREGTRFRRLEDSSYLAEAPAADRDTYEIEGALPVASFHGMQLEALLDPSLPGTGPGRSGSGNFTLGDVQVSVANPALPDGWEMVRFTHADADYSEPRHGVELAIDKNPESGWGVGEGATHKSRVARFLADRAYGSGIGTRIKVRLSFDGQAYNQHSIGRLRLSFSEAVPPKPVAFGKWLQCSTYPTADPAEAFDTPFAPEHGVDSKARNESGEPLWSDAQTAFYQGITYITEDVGAVYLYRAIESPEERTLKLGIGANDGIKVWLNGALICAAPPDTPAKPLVPEERIYPARLQKGRNVLLVKAVGGGTAYELFVRCTEDLGDGTPVGLQALATRPASYGDDGLWRDYFRADTWQDWTRLESSLAGLRRDFRAWEAEVPEAMIMRDARDLRETHVLLRGQYDQPGERVDAGVPEALGALPGNAPPNRLGLAEWIASRENPLTARVEVNRLWQMLLGTGLVRTVEDFGVQGEAPTHPELLDWLAVQLMDSGWDVKALIRTIVCSSVYRQRSNSNSLLNAMDPDDRLLARGPRFRLDAEVIRDNALALGGLLVRRIGGPGVRPYQPDLWKEVSFDATGRVLSAQLFVQAAGENLYRRSLYTFWKRQSPPPAMLTLDAPTREVTCARRARTNTPLQALVLMNDPQFMEAARGLAQRVLLESGLDDGGRLRLAFRLCVARYPTDAEMQVMRDLLQREESDFVLAPARAAALLHVGDSRPDPTIPQPLLAAWTTLASVLLNMDATLSHT